MGLGFQRVSHGWRTPPTRLRVRGELNAIRASLGARVLGWPLLILLAASPVAAMTPPGTAIDNNASADYVDSGTPTTIVSNTDTITTVAFNTPSTLQLLHYAPGNPAATPTAASAALCSASGGIGGPFNPPPPLSDAMGYAIDLLNPVDLAAGGAFHAGEPVFVRVNDPDENRDPMAVDAIAIALSSASGDSEAIELRETGLNTGEFAGALMSGPLPVVAADCRLQAAPGNTISANYVDPSDGTDVSAQSALVDPLGRIFDSTTGSPVDGARITLIDTGTGLPATVFGDDGVSSFPATLTTGGSATDSGGTLYSFDPGGFRFPLVAAGSYELQVTAPTGFSHPSVVPDAALQLLPAAPYMLGTGSRGLPFAVPVGPAVEVDIPLDPAGTGNLLLTKSPSKNEVQIGEFVLYTLQLSNPAGGPPMSGVSLLDQLPPGFRYEDGSLSVNDNGVADPGISPDGSTLAMALPALLPGTQHEIRYVVQVGAGTSTGTATNRAQASAAGGVRSNEATARVEVTEDVLAERSFLVGRVMAANSCDDAMTVAHNGVPGVRLFLENGTYVVTDAEGRFHFAGISADTHVLQMDIDTIPPDYEMLACPGNQFAGRAFSQFVEPQRGSLWRTDFFLRRTAPEGPTLRQDFSVRRDGNTLFFRLRYDVKGAGLEGGAATVVMPRGTRYVAGSAGAGGRGLLGVEHNSPSVTFRLDPLEDGDRAEINFSATVSSASEGIDPDAVVQAFLRGRSEYERSVQTEVAKLRVPQSDAVQREGVDVQHTEIPPVPEGAETATRLEVEASADPFAKYGPAYLAEAEPRNEWLFPASTEIPEIPSVKVVLQHDPALHVRLFLNGSRVSPLNFDGQIQNADNTLAVSRWRGVDLEEGPNRFHVLLEDEEGQLVEQLRQRVHYSGSPVSAELHRESSHLVADGRESPVLAVRLRDRWGQPVRRGVAGRFRLEPPYQTQQEVDALQKRPLEGMGAEAPTYRVEDAGLAYLRLHPTSVVGDARVRFRFGEGIEEEVSAWLEPGERDWVLVALAAGSLGFNDVAGHEGNRGDAGIDAGVHREGRMAFYAKGAVSGSWLVTAAYDSAAKRSRIGDRLLQALDPDEHYTLYGDDSVQGYDAPTSERVYLKVERRKFYALYGDYDTGLDASELAAYGRTFNGVKTEFRGDTVRWNAFATDADQVFVKDELQGNGSSGLYRLRGKDIVINSESVTLETRDRFRNDRVLETQTMARHLDYNINYQNGTLYFRTPVPSRDGDFNPIFIVVDYETDASGTDQYTGGGRAALSFFDDNVEVGMSGVHEDNGELSGNLIGGDATIRLGPQTELRAEYATSEREEFVTKDRGDAWLLGFDHHGEVWDVGVYAREQQAGFGLGQQRVVDTGLRSFGLDTRRRIGERMELDTSAFHEQDLETKNERSVVESELSYEMRNFGVRAGMRYARSEVGSGDTGSAAQLLTGTHYTFWQDRLTLRANGEVAVAGDELFGDYPTRAVVGGDYRISDSLQLFADQEFGFGERRTENTRMGLQASPWQGGSIATSLNQEGREYGPRTFANLGLQQRFNLNPEWSFDILVDRAQTLRNGDSVGFSDGSVPASGSTSEDFTALSVGSSFRRGGFSSTGRLETRFGDTENHYGILLGTLREHDADTSYSGRLNFFLTDPQGSTDQIELASSLSFAHRPLDSPWVALERVDIDFLRNAGSGTGLESLKLVNHFKLNYEFDRRTQFAAQYSAKLVLDRVDGRDYSSAGNLFGLEARHDLSDKWDVALHLRARHLAGGGSALQPNYGVALGRRLYDNLWLSVGYNFAGFYDSEFSASEYTAHGPYLRLRAKLDQVTVKSLLQRFAE